MSSVDNTLEIRGNRYGSMEDNARVTQTLLYYAMKGTTADRLSDVHKECLHMIFNKIARMVNGDCWYEDNPHDIAGYAKLLEDFIREQNNDSGNVHRNIT